jgi:4'-phosphopantetheinyl transferase
VDVGIDVEEIARVDEPMELARRVFAASEIEDLERHRGEERRRRFCEYWTLKEAYLKGRGVGLSVPLDGFAFRMDGEGGWPRLDRASGDDAEAWQFRLSRPTHGHVMAVALRRDQEQDLGIVERCTIPLGD